MYCCGLIPLRLTHWGRDNMAAIFQTTFSNAFSWMKLYELRFRFHWSLFPRVQLTIFQHWFRQWLGADQATSHYLNQCWLIYWRIYASLCPNELTNLIQDYFTGSEIILTDMGKYIKFIHYLQEFLAEVVPPDAYPVVVCLFSLQNMFFVLFHHLINVLCL